MKISQALTQASIDRLDAEILLAHALKKNRSWLISHGDDPIDDGCREQFEQLIQRRAKGEPVAYITGTKEFYGRDFIVSKDVLIPRPATEGLIEVALEFLENGKNKIAEIDAGIIAIARTLPSLRCRCAQHPSPAAGEGTGERAREIIVDLGTGSGCIAVTLAMERPDLAIIATDVSSDALHVTRQNAAKYLVSDRVDFRLGKTFIPIKKLDQPFIVVSNPPYIPSATKLMHDVANFEPKEALFAGKDGLAVIRKLVSQARAHPFCCGLVLECRADQQEAINVMFASL